MSEDVGPEATVLADTNIFVGVGNPDTQKYQSRREFVFSRPDVELLVDDVDRRNDLTRVEGSSPRIELMMFSVAALNAVIIASRIWSFLGIESSSSTSSKVSCASTARRKAESSQMSSSSVRQTYSASDRD
jgi:hypothetical protein